MRVLEVGLVKEGTPGQSMARLQVHVQERVSNGFVVGKRGNRCGSQSEVQKGAQASAVREMVRISHQRRMSPITASTIELRPPFAVPRSGRLILCTQWASFILCSSAYPQYRRYLLRARHTHTAPPLGHTTAPTSHHPLLWPAVIMAEQSINIPQVIVFLVVTFLAVRWYFSKPTTTRPSTEISRLIQDRADQLSQMFPQLDRRELGWDLRNNGGNVQATTERALSGRGFERVSCSARGCVFADEHETDYDVYEATRVVPVASATTYRNPCPIYCRDCKTNTSRPNNKVQPVFETVPGKRAYERGVTQGQGMEFRPERAAGQFATAAGGNDSGSKKKAPATGKFQGFGDGSIVGTHLGSRPKKFMIVNDSIQPWRVSRLVLR